MWLSCCCCCCFWVMILMMCASSVRVSALSSSLSVSSKRTIAAPSTSPPFRMMAHPHRQGITTAFASKLDLAVANEDERHDEDEAWRLRQQLLETTYDTTTRTTRPPILESPSIGESPLSSSDKVRLPDKNKEEDLLSSSFSSPMSSKPTVLRLLPNTVQYIATLLLGTYVTSCVLTELLANFEWVQAWRYSWPLGMGILYMLLNALPPPSSLDHANRDSINTTPRMGGDDSSPASTIKKHNDNLLISILQGETRFIRAILFVLGLGLVIGGAYDLWMPVYETGPNVLTAAGIGQDAALGLFAGTLVQIIILRLLQLQQQRHEHLHRPDNAAWNRLLPIVVVLLAQLYKLGEGSFEELFFSSSSWS